MNILKKALLYGSIALIGIGTTAGATYGIMQKDFNKRIEVAKQEFYDNALSDSAYYKSQLEEYATAFAEQKEVMKTLK